VGRVIRSQAAFRGSVSCRRGGTPGAATSIHDVALPRCGSAGTSRIATLACFHAQEGVRGLRIPGGVRGRPADRRGASACGFLRLVRVAGSTLGNVGHDHGLLGRRRSPRGRGHRSVHGQDAWSDIWRRATSSAPRSWRRVGGRHSQTSMSGYSLSSARRGPFPDAPTGNRRCLSRSRTVGKFTV